MNLEAVLARLNGVRRNGSGWQARCPAHEDHNPSLSISEHEGKTLVHCHAGCSQEAVLAAAKIEKHEFFPQNGAGRIRAKLKIAKTYDYLDENGTLLYQKVRYSRRSARTARGVVYGGG
jgi:putative DNA primase/helicase